MNLKEYQKFTESQMKPMKTPNAHLIHILSGLTTELGEIQQIFQKSCIKNLMYADRDIDKIHLQEEIGDLIFYISELCNRFNLDIDKIIKGNVEKLKRRYKI